jgi:hypothetical protein
MTLMPISKVTKVRLYYSKKLASVAAAAAAGVAGVCVVTADPTACMVGSANSNTTVQYNDTG